MPPPKVKKAMHLLVDSNLDYGHVEISYKFLEQYRGNQQYWSIVMPPMRCLLGTTDTLMKGGKMVIGSDHRATTRGEPVSLKTFGAAPK